MTLVIVAMLAVIAQSTTPAKLPGTSCAAATLVGTWKVVDAKENGQAIPTGENNAAIYKLLTPTHYMVFQVAPESKAMAWAHGGTYTVSNGTYTESIDYGYGAPFQQLKGQSAVLKCTPEGDDTGHVAGTVVGVAIVEKWMRVK